MPDRSTRPIICKRVTCSPPSPWHSNNQAQTRPHPHSSTLSRHILCTYQSPLQRRAHRILMDISVSLEHPLPRYNSRTSKDIKTQMFLCIQLDKRNRASIVNHHRCTSPPTVISNTFLTFPHGGSTVQLRSWVCNLARVLFRRARTTSNKTCDLLHAYNA